MFGNGGEDPEEDAVIKVIEDMACKAYAVFTFADTKFRAVVPPLPSASAVEIGRSVEEEAVLAGEAFVLYLKALALLQSGMDVAKEHWAKVTNQKTERGGVKVAGMRLNSGMYV